MRVRLFAVALIGLLVAACSAPAAGIVDEPTPAGDTPPPGATAPARYGAGLPR